MKTRRKLLIAAIGIYFISSPTWADTEILTAKFLGLPNPILKNVEDRFAIIKQEYGDHPTFDDAQAFYKNGPKNIEQAIKPYGFFKAHISRSYLTRKGKTWTAVYVIDLGPPLKIQHIDANLSGPGVDNAALRQCLNDLPIKPGQVLETENYEKAKQQFFQVASEEGYLKAYFDEQLIKINLETNTATIILHFNTRERYYFGPVHFNQDTFSESFLRRYMNFKEGQAFSSQTLLQLQQNLNNTNYFSAVAVTPELQQAPHDAVPIDITLKPNKGQQYNAGIGYGTFTGARLTLDAKFRHLNRFGHHADLQMKLSKVLGGFAAQYVIPGKDPLNEQYSIGANTQKFSPKKR